MLENGFVLLKEAKINFNEIIENLKKDWQIEAENIEAAEDSFMFTIGTCFCSIALMPVPIPNNEAVQHAKLNYYCQNAVEIAQKHQAHLMVTLMDRTADNEIEGMKIYSKIIASCLAQDTAIGIYTSGTVFDAHFYRQVCNQYLHTSKIPLVIWVFIVMGKNEQGNQLYTVGMEKFGKKEIEILNASLEMEELHTALLALCDYVITSNLVLQDGETIGFSEQQRWAISLSRSVYAAPEESLKISIQ